MAKAFQARVGLSDFYDAIQEMFGVKPVPMVGEWSAAAIDLVTDGVSAAVSHCGIIGTAIPNFAVAGSGKPRTNQSKGNVAADAIANAIGCLPEKLAVEKLKGGGYPDRILILHPKNIRCCVEFKATSEWKEKDSNRRVLTSSTKKLSQAMHDGRLPQSPCHLLVTVVYDDPGGIVRRVRLDFLQPKSLVNVRYEASTSHKLLSAAEHEIREIS